MIRLVLIGAAIITASGVQAQIPMPADLIKQWDKNGDGAVDKVEWTGAGRPAEHFNATDLDKDGKVTVEELQTVLQTIRQLGG